MIKRIAALGLIIGGLLGTAGSFAPSDSLRLLAWNIDGIALVTACSLLMVYYFQKEMKITALGFLIFTIGEYFILFSNGIQIEEHTRTFGIGLGGWAISLAVISSQRTFPSAFRIIGLIAVILFSITAILIFTGNPIHPLTKPLPFFAYPFLVMTLLGWAWTLWRKEKSKPALYFLPISIAEDNKKDT